MHKSITTPRLLLLLLVGIALVSMCKRAEGTGIMNALDTVIREERAIHFVSQGVSAGTSLLTFAGAGPIAHAVSVAQTRCDCGERLKNTRLVR